MPHEAISGDRAAHVVGDLPRLVERATHQQHAELVAAEPRDRVRVAHRFAQQLGDFAQHAVAGEMTAGVVDDLEAIEIEVTQHVRGLAAARGFRRLVEAVLELAPVHEARQRIVRRLVRHLSMQAAQLGDVVQQDDRANELVVSSRNGDAASSMARSSPEVLPSSTARRLRLCGVPSPPPTASLHRIGEQLAVVLVDQADDVLERPAQRLRASHA